MGSEMCIRDSLLVFFWLPSGPWLPLPSCQVVESHPEGIWGISVSPEGPDRTIPVIPVLATWVWVRPSQCQCRSVVPVAVGRLSCACTPLFLASFLLPGFLRSLPPPLVKPPCAFACAERRPMTKHRRPPPQPSTSPQRLNNTSIAESPAGIMRLAIIREPRGLDADINLITRSLIKEVFLVSGFRSFNIRG